MLKDLIKQAGALNLLMPSQPHTIDSDVIDAICQAIFLRYWYDTGDALSRSLRRSEEVGNLYSLINAHHDDEFVICAMKVALARYEFPGVLKQDGAYRHIILRFARYQQSGHYDVAHMKMLVASHFPNACASDHIAFEHSATFIEPGDIIPFHLELRKAYNDAREREG